MRSCKPQNHTLPRFLVNPNPQPCQICRKTPVSDSVIRLRLSFTRRMLRISNHQRLKTGDDSLVALDPIKCGVGPGIFLA